MPKKKEVVVAVSGGFDPLHVGHLRLFEEAKKLGTKLVVILNNDHWLVKKKGYALMPEGERKAIIEALRMVDGVVITAHARNDSDTSVCKTLGELRPDIFANAGDRKNPKALPSPETKLCMSEGIEMRFFQFDDLLHKGGKKKHSSSNIIQKAVNRFLGVQGGAGRKKRLSTGS